MEGTGALGEVGGEGTFSPPPQLFQPFPLLQSRPAALPFVFRISRKVSLDPPPTPSRPMPPRSPPRPYCLKLSAHSRCAEHTPLQCPMQTRFLSPPLSDESTIGISEHLPTPGLFREIGLRKHRFQSRTYAAALKGNRSVPTSPSRCFQKNRLPVLFFLFRGKKGAAPEKGRKRKPTRNPLTFSPPLFPLLFLFFSPRNYLPLSTAIFMQTAPYEKGGGGCGDGASERW